MFLLPNGSFLTNSCLSYEFWDILSIDPVFNIPDALSPTDPIRVGGSGILGQKLASVPVFLTDGSVQISNMSASKTMSVSTISKQEIKISEPIFAFSAGRHTPIGMPTSVVLGIDKGVRFIPPSYAQSVRLKYEDDSTPMTDRRATTVTTSFSCSHVHWKNFHMDSYSGTMVLGQSAAMDIVIIDFPLHCDD